MKNRVVFVCALHTSICFTLIAGSCNVTYFGSLGGVITSPWFPFNYSGKIDCEYKIIVPYSISKPGNHSILCFRFQRFDLEINDVCNYDYLSLNGVKFCGKGEISQPYRKNMSVGYPQTVWDEGLCWRIDYDCWPYKTFDIAFHSDSATVGKGFYATFFIKPDNCDFPCITNSSLINSSITCQENCVSGYMVNENGCQTCSCKPTAYHQEAPCWQDQYTCFDRQCIPANGRCDRNPTKDCADYSDEIEAHAMCSDRVNHSITCSFTESMCAWSAHFEQDFYWKREDYNYYFDSIKIPTRTGYDFHAQALTYIMEPRMMVMSTQYSPAELKVDLGRYAYTDHSKIRCMSFWYYIPRIIPFNYILFNNDDFRRSQYDLYFKLETDTGSYYLWKRNLLKNYADQYFGKWHEGMFEIPPTANMTTVHIRLGLEWSKITSEDYFQRHKIAIDDISMLDGKCWPSSDISCTFIHPGFCDWASEKKENWLPLSAYENSSVPWHSASSLFGPERGCYFAGVPVPAGMGCAYVTFSPTDGVYSPDGIYSQTSSDILFGTPIGVVLSDTSCLRFKYASTRKYYYHLYRGFRLYIFYYDDRKLSSKHIYNVYYGTDDIWHDIELNVSHPVNGPFRIGIVAYYERHSAFSAAASPYTVMISDISFVNASCTSQRGIWPYTTTTTTEQSCPSGQFSCGKENNFLKCIDRSRLCDINPDCIDGRDESDYTCKAGLKELSASMQIAGVVILVICSFGTLVLFVFLVKLMCNFADRSHDPWYTRLRESTESGTFSAVYNAAGNCSEAVVATSATDRGS